MTDSADAVGTSQSQAPRRQQLASSAPTSMKASSALQSKSNPMITLESSGRGSTPEMQHAAEVCTDDDIVASILSDAQRSTQCPQQSAQSERTSEILRSAGCVLSSSPVKNARSPSPSMHSPAVLRDRLGSDISISPLPHLSMCLSSSPLSSPPRSPAPALDDSIHLPGKFCSLSSAEVKQKLTSSPIKRTELLSKLDGLDRVVPHNSSMLSTNSSMDASEEVASKVIQSSSAVSAAMHSAHAHADRIKNAMLTKKKLRRSRSISIGNDPIGEHRRHASSPPDSSSKALLKLSSLAIDQSTRTRRQTPVPSTGMLSRWVQRKIESEASPTSKDITNKYFGQYEIHTSETTITHELNRGDWTWTTEWSPDGKYLALATENHGLAIVETKTWKIIHDERIGKLKNDSTHTIRSICWGGNFVAVGGTGDSVSIIEPRLISSEDSSNNEKYSFEIVNVIKQTGFVGALTWLKNTNILAIGSRTDQCLIAEVKRGIDGTVTSSILHNIERSDWVNAVKFSHGGTKLAIGNRNGILSVYLFVLIRPGEAPALSPLQDISLDDNICTIEWSPDSRYIYTGGEDYTISVIDTAKYSVVRKIGRDRWVTFLALSHDGSYLAAGGVSHQVSLFDTNKGWEEVTSLPVDGGIPLSTKWHPKDQFIAITGQFNDVVVFEASSQRLSAGKCLRSKSSILAIEFSPDSKLVAVGNEDGLLTLFDTLSSPTCSITYETVIGIGGDMSIKWSPDGRCIAVTSGSTFVLLDSTYSCKEGTHPPSSAHFLVRKVIQCGVCFTSISFSSNGHFLALADDQTRILDLRNGCDSVRLLDLESEDVDHGIISLDWSDDGALLAMAGRSNVTIYDTCSSSPDKWVLLFAISFKSSISSLCWGPPVKKGLHYLAFGGENENVAILEVRTREKIWETVLQIECKSMVNDLAWNDQGLLSIGDDDGTVSVVDLSYLGSGDTVGSFNYNWQRQGVISQTRFTRNDGRNAITSLCWAPTKTRPNNGRLLAFGGSDGIFEMVDLS